MRTSPDGHSWSPWEAVHVEMPPGPLAQYNTYGALIWADRASYVQFLGQVQGSGRKPSLHRIGLMLLNPYDGPLLETVSDSGDGGLANTAFAAEADSDVEAGAAPAAAIGKPITFKREDWGADESLRFSGGQEIWPRSYVPTKKLIVRAIYTCHARSLGWGDIGYNWLIDKFGNSYEGRRGRDGPGYDGPGGREILSEDVVGGHALAYNYGSSGIALLGTFCTPAECLGAGSPSSAMISRLNDVLTWECQQHGTNPQADSDFLLHYDTWHRGLRNLVGHRDVFQTRAQAVTFTLLPQLWAEVAAVLASPSRPAVSITSAPPEDLLTSGTAEFAWQGSGGAGGLEYSYYLEGWSKPPDASQVTYISGYTTSRSPAWSPWRKETSARFCFVAGGLYTFHVRVRDATGQTSVYEDSRTFLGTQQAQICDGALLQGTGPAVYVMQGGLKRHIPNLATFEARGFQRGNVNYITDSFIGSIPKWPAAPGHAGGREPSPEAGPAVYVMEGGQKRHITSEAAFAACGYGWDAVYMVPDTSLDVIPTGSSLSGPPCPRLSPPDGALIQGSYNPVYVMDSGLKRHIVSPRAFAACGYLWGNINHIADSALGGIPMGDDLTEAACP